MKGSTFPPPSPDYARWSMSYLYLAWESGSLCECSTRFTLSTFAPSLSDSVVWRYSLLFPAKRKGRHCSNKCREGLGSSGGQKACHPLWRICSIAAVPGASTNSPSPQLWHGTTGAPHPASTFGSTGAPLLHCFNEFTKAPGSLVSVLGRSSTRAASGCLHNLPSH